MTYMDGLMNSTIDSQPSNLNTQHSLPPLARDPAFRGMVATQFLGAFNDNVFKQMVLLVVVDYAIGTDAQTYQPWAQGAFALPFVLLSGFAGWLSDRTSKRTNIVLCKVAEIFVMLAGMLVLLLTTPKSEAMFFGLLGVLLLMGVQSAFFGPSKYGILPELLRDDDLPTANGIIQMTTFLAIILGAVFAGVLKEWWEPTYGLWPISAVCIVLAILGTITSLPIRKGPPAQPDLPLRPSAFFVDKATFALFRHDIKLLGALMATILFWFLGGVTLQVVTDFAKQQLQLGDKEASFLAAAVSLGIAIGCMISGTLSKHTVRFGLVRAGAWGMSITFPLIASLQFCGLSRNAHYFAAGGLFIAMGASAGLFAVPLQVFLQSRPAREQKGRVIGAMNLTTWMGILVTAGVYGLCANVFGATQISLTFYVLAALILPVALFYRPEDVPLKHE